MPTAPNASTDLSGGSGTTKTVLIQRVLRRLDDEPVTDGSGSSLTNSATSLTVTSTTPYTVGGTIDWVEDGTFETALITAVPNSTTLTIRRGHRGSTAASHAANAVFRYRGLYVPHNLSELVDEAVFALWPELYDVREVNWTISTSATPELWYGVPADCEKVIALYQQTSSSSSPLNLMGVATSTDVTFLESGFIGATEKGIQVRGISQSSADGLLHATYLARLALTNLTDAQVSILVYRVGCMALETRIAGESKPDRRVSARSAPDPQDAWRIWQARQDELTKKEVARLREYLPRTLNRNFQQARHFGDSASIPARTTRTF